MIEHGHFFGRAAVIAITLCGLGCSDPAAAGSDTDAGTSLDAGARVDAARRLDAVTTRPDARSTPVARDAARPDVTPRDAQPDVSSSTTARTAPTGNVVLYQSYGVENTCLSVWVAPGTAEDGRVYLRRPCDPADTLNTWRFEPVSGQPQVYNLRSNGYDGDGFCVTRAAEGAFLAIGDCAEGGNAARWRLLPDPDSAARIFQLQTLEAPPAASCLSCVDEGDAWCVRRACWPEETDYSFSFFNGDPAM